MGTAVAERLKAHRTNSTQYTQMSAAAAIKDRFGDVGLGDQTLKRIESGQSPLTLDGLAILCEIYGLSPVEVVETATATVEIADRHAARRREVPAISSRAIRREVPARPQP